MIISIKIVSVSKFKNKLKIRTDNGYNNIVIKITIKRIKIKRKSKLKIRNSICKE